MSEAEATTIGEDEHDDRVIMNMGPSHPSTHGVLRLMLEMDGETVLRSKPVVGYLHTGMEKTGEELSYVQGCTNVTRMDYAAPLFSELAFSLTTEALLEVEIPPRATWIRMLLCEINRITSHLLFMATNGMDLGAVSMMIYGWREREEGLRLLEKITGLRMNHNFIRPGGVAADLPDGWVEDVIGFIDLLPPRLEEYDTLMTGQPIWRERLQGVGTITPDEAIALSATGPLLRSTGVPWDLRRDTPYLAYDQIEFDVVVGNLRRLVRPIRHPAQRDPGIDPDHRAVCRPHARGRLPGPGPQGDPTAPGPAGRVDGSVDPPLQDLHRGIPGAGRRGVRLGRVPRGELGCFIVSDGGPKPYRMRIRPPSYINLQTLPHLMRGRLIADAVAVISSVDPIMGEVDR